MKLIALAVLALAGPARAGIYYDLQQTASSATMRMGGVIKLGTTTAVAPGIIIDGATGSVETTSPLLDSRVNGGLVATLSKVGASFATIIMAQNETINQDLTIPANIELRFTYVGGITVTAGHTVTIIGKVDAGWYQIFGGGGSVVFNGAQNSQYSAPVKLKVDWWGADPSHAANTGTLNQIAISSAIAALPNANVIPTIEFMPAGFYRIDGSSNVGVYFTKPMYVQGNGARLDYGTKTSTAVLAGAIPGTGTGGFSNLFINDLRISRSGAYAGTCILFNSVAGGETKNIDCSDFRYAFSFYSDAGSGGNIDMWNPTSSDNLVATVFDSTATLVGGSSINAVRFHGGDFVLSSPNAAGSRDVLIRNSNQAHKTDGIKFYGTLTQATAEIKYEILQGQIETYGVYTDVANGGTDVYMGTATFNNLYLGGDGAELEHVLDYGTGNAFLDTKYHLSALKYVTNAYPNIAIATTTAVTGAFSATKTGSFGTYVQADSTHYLGDASSLVTGGTLGQTALRGHNLCLTPDDGSTCASYLTTGLFTGWGTKNPATKMHMSSGTFTVDGTGAAISVAGGSVTASAFFGDGSHLTGVAGATETVTAALTGVGTVASPLGVNSSSVAVLSGGFVLNSQIDGSSITKLSSGLVPNSLIDGSSVTKQGNSFNAASKLVQLNSSTQYPALNGSLITTLSPNQLGIVGSNTGTIATTVGDTSSTECVAGSTVTFTLGTNTSGVILVTVNAWYSSTVNGDVLANGIFVDGARVAFETAGTGLANQGYTSLLSSAQENMGFAKIVTGLAAGVHNVCVTAWHNNAGVLTIGRLWMDVTGL